MLINNIINPGFGCKNPVQSLILIIKIINLRSVVFSYRLKAIFELIPTKLVFCSFQMTILFYKKYESEKYKIFTISTYFSSNF